MLPTKGCHIATVTKRVTIAVAEFLLIKSTPVGDVRTLGLWTHVHHGPAVDDPGDVGWRVTAGRDAGHADRVASSRLLRALDSD